ncbi:hypothetical protein SLEP1_g2045 [Rubroshorea leprosula]|uniref:Uncharacterized protein n=1 Tax=Rubroshorea leprosula TaxID=152421 RepID=A0AAV5HRP4_9ROSI|nr:hypothetical protein SLEP1_g2045 [Rubroshorea leprosula]
MGLWIVSEGKAINYGTSAASLLFTGSSHQNCCLSSRLLSCPAFVDVVRPNQFSFAVFAGETAAVPKDCSSEQISFSDSVSVPDEPMMDGGEKDEEESFDSHKMIRVCDKLIEIFMVDKPTPADWRRGYLLLVKNGIISVLISITVVRTEQIARMISG